MADPTSKEFYGYLTRIADPHQRQLLKLIIDKLHALDATSAGIGGVTKPLTTALDAASQKITALKDPTANQDAATKIYVDKTINIEVLKLKTQLGQPLTTTSISLPIPQSDGPSVPSPGTPAPVPPNAPPTSASIAATDAIPIASITIENSIDVSTWPITTAITQLSWQTTGVALTFDKQSGASRWPDQPFGSAGGTLQYTLWIVFLISGVYYGSGIIQYWFGLAQNGGPPSGVAANWVYASRWGPMQGHQPAVGENVWMFVTAGDARNNATSTVHERSQIIQIPFPSDAGGTFTS